VTPRSAFTEFGPVLILPLGWGGAALRWNFYVNIGRGMNEVGRVRDAILNNPRVFSLTKHRFISTQLLNRTCVTYFDLYLGHPQGCQYKNLTKENTIKT